MTGCVTRYIVYTSNLFVVLPVKWPPREQLFVALPVKWLHREQLFVALKKKIKKNGRLTSSCLWLYR